MTQIHDALSSVYQQLGPFKFANFMRHQTKIMQMQKNIELAERRGEDALARCFSAKLQALVKVRNATIFYGQKG